MSNQNAGSCPTDKQLQAYVLGRLSQNSDAKVVRHLKNCSTCTSAVNKIKDNVRQRLESIAEPPARPPKPKPISPQPNVAPKAASNPADSSQATSSPNGTAGETPAGESTGGMLLKVLAGTAALILVGAAAFMMSRPDNRPAAVKQNAETNNAPEPDQPGNNEEPEGIPEGLVKGEIPGNTPLESVRVLIQTGAGESLAEPVDLQLGFGFPLRLYPVGTTSRTPNFAAFPHSTSLDTTGAAIAAGDSAWFEFGSDPEEIGFDDLHHSPTLLDGLKVSDITQIGFASLGQTDWILDGYQIDINGELFASHGGMNAKVAERKADDEIELERQLPELESLEEEIETLETYLALDEVSPDDRAELDRMKSELTRLSGQVRSLAGRLMGTHPWFTEEKKSLGLTAARNPVEQIKVKVMTTGNDRPGSQNSLFLQVGPRKYPITSNSETLADEQVLQEFEIIPVSGPPRSSFDQIGIGMLASDTNFGLTPDRAQLQRVILEADGESIYDSELEQIDRTNLAKYWLVPPAHRDEFGTVVENEHTENVVSRWRPGMSVAAVSDENKPDAPVDPEPVTTPTQPEGPPSIGGLQPPPIDLPETTSTEFADAGTTGGAGAGGSKTLGGTSTTAANSSQGSGSHASAAQLDPLLSQLIRSLLDFRRLARIAARAAAQQQANTTTSQTVNATLTPSPGKPVISDIRFSATLGAVLENRPVTVTWTMTGDSSAVDHYDVTLHPVLPHDRRPFIALPLATISPVKTTSAVLTPNVTPALLGRLPAGSVLEELWVQPEVKAKDVNNNTLGVSQFGPLLPLISRKVTPANIITLRPGPIFPDATRPPGTPVSPGFQINGNGYSAPPANALLWPAPVAPLQALATAAPWNPLTGPVAAGTSSAVWQLTSPTSCHNGWTLDAFGQTQPILQISHNMAFRPVNNFDTAVFRYDAQGVTLTQNMQLLANFGFLNGPASTWAQATCNVQVLVSSAQPANAALLPTQVINGVASQIPLQPHFNDGYISLKLIDNLTNTSNAAPIVFNKLLPGGTPAPMPVLRIPIDLGIVPVGSNPQAPLPAGFSVVHPPPGNLGVPTGTPVNITVLFGLNVNNGLLGNVSTAPLNNEALGVFGVRIVPQ